MLNIRRKQTLSLYLSMLFMTLIGCSEQNAQSLIDPDTGSHAKDWLPAAHMKAVTMSGPDDCSSCHGTDLEGGISGISCTSCHLGGPTSVHPADWVPVYSTHDPYVEASGTGACANLYCHGASLTGVANSGPSCMSCHMGGVMQIHPAGWLGDACSNHGNYAYTNGTAGCSNAACHGADLGGVSQSGPSCTQCHNPIPNSNQCNYCHGIPPNGTVYPNTAGKHAKHMQLSGVTCATCHIRLCDQHGNGIVEVIIDPIYNAKTGIASFTTTSSGKTCSEISCHGGPRTQTPDQAAAQNPPQSDPGQTPDWYTGSIDVYNSPTYDFAQCTACHVYGTTEYNSFFSGKHLIHCFGWNPYAQQYTFGYVCAACHDFNKLSVTHFTSLSSSVISAGTASATILDYMKYDGTKCNQGVCHGPGRDW